MNTRAWWLVVLNVLLPGSVQLLAGSRRLGRFAVVTTFILWLVAAVLLVLFLVNRAFVLSLATNVWLLLVAEIVLAAYAVLWLVLTLDTLRLVRLIRTGPVVRPLVAFVALVGLVATAGGAAYAANVADATRSTIAAVFDSGEYAEPVDGRYNILLLGGGAGPDRMGLRPDSISVASVDAETGDTSIIGIPRNMEFIQFSEGSPLYGPFPHGYDCGDDCLISYLYTYGQEHPELYPNAEAEGSLPGIEAMRDAVSGVVGLTIQYYVLIDMQGFDDLIDALGGVVIDVKERQPIGGDEDARGNPINVEGWVEVGERRLSGWSALWYARARHGTNDYDRMKRQRDVQEAILRQFEPANVLSKFRAVAEAGKQVVSTDIPSVMLGLFVDLAGKAKELPITRLELSPPDFSPVNPDYELIHESVQGTFVRYTPPPE
jgi:LCP family protein required for cell wall assembly